MHCFPTESFLRQHCRRIFINDLTLPCSIGIYEEEKKTRQRLCLNVDVWVLKGNAAPSDCIANVLDYDVIGNILRQAAVKHTNLQETLIHRLITKIAVLPNVILVRLATAKLDAYPDAMAVGIEEWLVGPSFFAISDTHD